MSNNRTGPDYLARKKKKKKDDPSDYVGHFERVMGQLRERKKKDSKIQKL